MKIGILICDKVLPELLHIAGEYDGMFRKLFRDAGQNVEIKSYNAVRGELPSSFDDVDGFISTGSKRSVYEQEQWIADYADFIRTLYKERKKLIGVCFGHQIMAHALGGKIVKSTNGWHVGLKTTSVAEQRSWMAPPLLDYNLLYSNKDQVEVLPKGATLLGKSARCPIAMFQMDDCFLGIQGHPEFEAPYMKALFNSRKDIIPPDIIESALKTIEHKTNGIEIAKWFINFIRS